MQGTKTKTEETSENTKIENYRNDLCSNVEMEYIYDN